MKRALAIVGGVLAAAMFIPVTQLNCPAWDVDVVDEAGKPVLNVEVDLTYQNYSAEGERHTAKAFTDANGHASFPPQTLHAFVGQYVFYSAKMAPALVHASYGRFAWVFAFVPDESMSNDPYYWQGSPDRVHSRLVLKKMKH